MFLQLIAAGPLQKIVIIANLFLPLSSPSIWMLAHLNLNKTCSWGNNPRCASNIFWKNDNLAWGSSSLVCRRSHLYFEKLNPQNDKEYLSPSGYKSFYREKLISKKMLPVVSWSSGLKTG